MAQMSQPVPGRRLLLVFVLPVAIALASPVMAATVAQPWHVVGESMEPVIEDGSVVLVDGLGPRLTGYGRGDIVVLSVPQGAARGYPVLVKRIVGLPGDRVTVREGGVVLNGQRLREPYVAEVAAGAVPRGRVVDVVVPSGAVWVMGDHRINSFDSVAFGAVAYDQLLGRVWFSLDPDGEVVVTPVSAAGP